jgi:hypothetical protein
MVASTSAASAAKLGDIDSISHTKVSLPYDRVCCRCYCLWQLPCAWAAAVPGGQLFVFAAICQLLCDWAVPGGQPFVFAGIRL